MSTGQIILGIALFAVAAAILYAWGLKKSIDQQEDTHGKETGKLFGVHSGHF